MNSLSFIHLGAILGNMAKSCFKNARISGLVTCIPRWEKSIDDEVELFDESHFILIGRLDEVINTGGIKIHPRVVEEILRSNHLEKEFFVCGTPHPDLGSQITVVINAEKDSECSSVKEFIETLDWPNYHKPRKVISKNFIYTATGKIDKRATL